ncbi:hypothetical protein DOTSEDRAFT_68152 [Dothistroma septosporum NZE10]|uniref:Zn(2)-C6 fungal-type domain-containing protein n=1 Tax=Dothistroma septosporum (strain NZE10 / CBS 128990) TaxID=675120 RepID=N1Q0I3_DOTSN|nr:hypothetical protein DOTSEDRAFT_68152 [Dothistroma septosporum NZE10]
MASSPPEVPAHRACAGCRSQKVRCILDEANSDVCQRCARAGRVCVFTPLQKRRQRKRTDTRVAELEKEMRAMRAALAQKNEAVTSDTSGQQREEPQRARPIGLWYKDTLPDAARLGQAGNWDEPLPEPSLARPAPLAEQTAWSTVVQPRGVSKDVIDSGLISMATARQLFETYKHDLFPHYPLVAIPSSITAESMRETKPALFLAVIAAASGKENPELSAALDKEVLQAYATRSLLQSEKSLELVQALLVSAVWYHPPSKFGQLKYYEYIHMAASMAMDIGIGSRPSAQRSRIPRNGLTHFQPIHPAEDVRNPDLSMTPRFQDMSSNTATLESRRTFLGCYAISAGISLSLRRPNMLRVGSHIRECVDYIERAPNALSTDSTLVAWVRLLIIAEEISTSFSYDDPGGIASITELRTQLMLKEYEKRLTAWYVNLPEADIGSGSMLVMYHTIRLFLFEIALHIDHSPEDFRAPYQMGGVVHPWAEAEVDQIPTQVLAECIAECVTSSHSLLNLFLAMDVDSCRALPVFSYVRISFGAFVLAKLCLSAAHPRSRIGQVLDKSSLKVEAYMDRMILHVRNIVGPTRSRVPSIFLALLFKLRQWCLDPQIIDQQDATQPSFDLRKDKVARQIADRDPEGDSDDRTPSSFAMELDGPRITEHFSSSEDSPNQSSPRTTGGATTSGGAETVPAQPNHATFGYSFTDNAASTAGMPQNYSGGLGSGSTNNIMYTPTTDGMQIDAELLQFIADMNTTSEGGLTGLDDWGSIPLGGLELMGWNLPANTSGHHIT